MRFYKSDGSFETREETAFGWNVNNFIIDESVPDFEEKNKRTRFNTRSKVTEIDMRRDSVLEESVPVSDLYKSPSNFKLIDPKIEVCKVTSAVSTIVGPFGPDGKLIKDRLVVDIEDPPSKEKLSSLINPCNPEAKALLSVINYSKYQQLKAHMSEKGEIFDFVNFKNQPRFVNTNKTNNCGTILKDIQSLNENKSNKLSLMSEVTLADMHSNVSDLVDVNDSGLGIYSSECDSSDLDSYIPPETTSDSSLKPKFMLGGELNSSFLGKKLIQDEINSCRSFSEEFASMKVEIQSIKECFEQQRRKTARIIKGLRTIDEDQKCTDFLDDLINLLDGKLEEVKRKVLSPFKLLNHEDESSCSSEQNLII